MDKLLPQLRGKTEIKVLFLCAGNIVRSPMAEMLLEFELERKYGNTRIKPFSGATTYVNDRIMEISKDLLMKEGITQERIYKFFPRHIREYPELLEDADLIIGMESTHTRLIPKEYRFKAFTLSELAAGEKRNIPDPWGDELSAYQEAFEVIKDYIKKLVVKLEDWGLIP